MAGKKPLRIGVLALQGAYDLHRDMCERLGATTSLVKKPADLDNIDGLILPGGESTVMTKLMDSAGLTKPIMSFVRTKPVLATCAGLILLATVLESLDIEIERNAYGTQVDSFETDVTYMPTGSIARAHFIRAPKIISVGSDATPCVMHDEEVVGVSHGDLVALTFHPEVAAEPLFHQIFVDTIASRLA